MAFGILRQQHGPYAGGYRGGLTGIDPFRGLGPRAAAPVSAPVDEYQAARSAGLLRGGGLGVPAGALTTKLPRPAIRRSRLKQQMAEGMPDVAGLTAEMDVSPEVAPAPRAPVASAPVSARPAAGDQGGGLLRGAAGAGGASRGVQGGGRAAARDYYRRQMERMSQAGAAALAAGSAGAVLGQEANLRGAVSDRQLEQAREIRQPYGRNLGAGLGASAGLVGRGGAANPMPAMGDAGGAGLGPLRSHGTQNVARPTDEDVWLAGEFQTNDSYREKKVADMRDRYDMGLLGRQPVGREALVDARMRSGDLTSEEHARVTARRQSYLDSKAEREELRQQRGIAKGALRQGVVLDADGNLDVTGSMVARAGRMNPLLGAAMGVQRDQANAEAAKQRSLLGIQQAKADAELAAIRAKGMIGEDGELISAKPLTPEEELDAQIASGVELDQMDDDAFATMVGGLIFGTEGQSPEEQAAALRRNGVRPDQLQRFIDMNADGWFSFMESDAERAQRLRAQARAEELMQILGANPRPEPQPSAAPALPYGVLNLGGTGGGSPIG